MKVLKQFERELSSERTNPFAKWRRVPLETHASDYKEFQLARGTTEKQANLVYTRITRILHNCGVKLVEDLSVSKVVTTVDQFRKQPRSPTRKAETYPSISNQTKCFYAKAIKQLTAWMLREGRIESDPLVHLQMSWNVQIDIRHARRSLSDEEILLLDDAAETSSQSVEGMTGPQRAFLYRVAQATGLRKNELDSLTASSFRFDDPPRIVVEAAFSKHREQDIVFIRPDMIEPLKERVSLLQPGEPLFPLLAQRKASKMIEADLTAAGIPYQDEQGRFADFHSLRHRFVTKAWETGESAPTVMGLARHKDIKTTLKYTHADTSAQLRAIQAMKPPQRNPE